MHLQLMDLQSGKNQYAAILQSMHESSVPHRNAVIAPTAEDLFSVILSTLKSKDVSFKRLVAQTYDGALNVIGCYNGQALIQRRINPNITYIHLFAHTLILVLSDTAAVTVDVIMLFGNLETLYLLFSKSYHI